MSGKIVFILLVSILGVSSSKCYGVALEGGGTHGAYEAGAMMAITEFLPPAEYRYSIITGISIGAINSCPCVGFEMGDERAMAEYMQGTWTNITGASMIATEWRGGLFWSLFFRPSIYNNANELKYIQKRTGTSIKRNITVAATNLNTGEYTKFTQDIGIEMLPTACFASGAWPGVFPSVNINGQWYGDGAVTSNLDPYHGIEKCRELGYSDNDIVMDLLFDEPSSGPGPLRVNRTYEAMNRIRDVYNWNSGYWYISQTFENFPDVDFRIVLQPSQKLPPTKPGMPMDFDPKDIRFEIDLGYNDTKALLGLSKEERKMKHLNRHNFHAVHHI